MSAMTVHTPTFELPRRSATVIAFPQSRRAPSAAVVAAPTRALRLTRRGRLAVTLLMAATLAVLALVGARTALADTFTSNAAPVEQVVVLPGDTLWSIAQAQAPGGDVREVVAEIRDLNQLTSSRLMVGQELMVPAA